MEKKNRWYLDDEKKKIISDMIVEFINKLAAFNVDNESCSRYDITLDLSDLTGVGPYHVKHIIEELGYEDDRFEDNGWQMDYWFHFIHPEANKFPPLCLSGTGIIHEIILRGEDEDYRTYEEREAAIKNNKEYQKMITDTINLLREIDNKILGENKNE